MSPNHHSLQNSQPYPKVYLGKVDPLMSSEDAQPALLNAFLLTTKDALMVFEAARRGICPVVTRRPGEGEKTKLIISGSVFAFDEQSTGIKRCEL